MIYELINPSDPYTFVADDLETAALVVFSISNAYGAKTEDGEIVVPVFILGGAEEWYKEQFGRSVEEGVEDKVTRLAWALGSMVLGSFEDRRIYETTIAAIDDQNKREEFIRTWKDKRSSINDIRAYCHKLAKKIEEGTNNGTET